MLKCLILFLLFICVNCAPIDNNEEQPASSTTKLPPSNNNNNEYDLSQFSEVYDQRQNGTENYRVSLNGVILMLAPAAGLLQAATLLDPALFEGEYPDLEELLNASNLNKPEDLFVVKPETTKPPPFLKPPPPPPSTSTTKSNDVPIVQENIKRKFKLPGLIRPFVRNPTSYY